MENAELIAGLVARRDEAERDIKALKKQIIARRSDLTQIDPAIRVLSPNLRNARLISTRHARSKFFVSGELTRRCQDALREASGAPITDEDIALTAMRDKLLDSSDTVINEDFTKRLLWTLNRLLLRGAVVKEGWGTATKWTLSV